jgi:competence protein ComEA
MRKLIYFIKQYVFGIIVISTSAASVIVAAYMAIQVSSYTERARLTVKENEYLGNKSKKPSEMIAVDLSGAVTKPGIILVKNGSRLSEALKIGGGLTQNAAQDYINQHINLSQILVDQQKIYIPTKAELLEQELSTNISTNNTDVNSLVNINQASAASLEDLPGIGEVTAEKIINNRPYSALDDLVDKKVINASTLDKIREKITL